MWTCPSCGRTFKNKNQQHTCLLIRKEDLFTKRPPELKTLCERILKVVESFGSYREETVRPDVIFLKTRSTFLAIKVKKDHLDIEFFLDHLEDVPPVSKYLQTSKHRVAHIVPIDSAGDVTLQLKKWMKASYDLIAK